MKSSIESSPRMSGPKASAKAPPAAASTSINREAVLYMVLLSLQFAFQPFLTRKFTPTTICRSTVILMQELLKLFLAFVMLCVSGAYESSVTGWNISTWIRVAFVPAALYAVQSMAALMAYQTLDALTFNVLNQTKTLSAALCCYLVMRRRQSCMQIISLFILLLSALVMENIVPLNFMGEGSEIEIKLESHHWTHGVLPIMLASFISGLAGALVQKNLQAQGGGRNSYLLTMELSAASALILCVSLTMSPDGKTIVEQGFWHGWMPETWIPILTQSLGGIVVGLVIKHAGSVRKGFALIFGMFLSGLVQAFVTHEGVSIEQGIGGFLAALSLWMHVSHPYVSNDERTAAATLPTSWQDLLACVSPEDDLDELAEPLLQRYLFPGPK